MADVVVPPEPADAVVPLEEGYDKPDHADDLLAWFARRLRRARALNERDLAVFVADR